MFSFLNSGILTFAISAVIPILIYLFAKRKPQKLIFSSIRFIKESQKKQKTKINLKNLLLLLIRICILLFTIMAIARPSVKSKFLTGSTKHPKTAIAIIIDNSYSMDYLVDSQTELDKAKEIVLRINSLISQDDITLLLTLDETWNQLYGHLAYGKMDINTLQHIRILSFPLSLKDVIKIAEAKLLESHIMNQEIYVITDFQKQELPEKFSIPTFFIPTSNLTERANLSCEFAELQSDFVTRSYRKSISFQVKNHSQYAQEDIICELFMNGRTIAEKVVQLQPKQTLTDAFSVVLESSGWHSGYVQVKNERLAYDNRYYFSFFYNHSPKVGMITDDKKLPFSIASILEIYTQTKENIVIIEPDKMDSDTFLAFDNIVIFKKNYISAKLQFLLSAFAKQSKGYLYIADKELTESSKTYLADYFKVKWDVFYDKPQLQKIEVSNPFHNVTKLLGINLSGMTDFWQSASLSATLLQTRNYPFVIESNRAMLWLFDCSSYQNQFLLDAAFPIFAYQTLRYLAEDYQIDSYQSGNRIPVENNQLQLPDGSIITVNQQFFTAKQPGLYTTGSNERKIAVNLDYRESVYERFGTVTGKNVQFTDEKWQNEILQARYGYEIWKILLLLVLVLFVLEMLLVKAEERKSK
jgi:hypothetical protein